MLVGNMTMKHVLLYCFTTPLWLNTVITKIIENEVNYYIKETLCISVCKWEREWERVPMNVVFDLLIQIIASGIPMARKQIDFQQNKK